jgi:hypothetical protein
MGTDYLDVTEPGGIQMISPGATATFEYRVALKPATSAQVTHGTGAIDVTLIAAPRALPDRLGTRGERAGLRAVGPAASVNQPAPHAAWRTAPHALAQYGTFRRD